MSETTNKKGIHVLLDRDLHKKALLQDVNWCRAFELGVKIMIGDNKEEKELRQKKIELEGELKYINTRLEETARIGDKKKRILTVAQKQIKFLKDTVDVLKQNKGALKARTKYWINVTGIDISQNELLELCRRAEMGEFDNNGPLGAVKGGRK
jgi:hypothetical protein